MTSESPPDGETSFDQKTDMRQSAVGGLSQTDLIIIIAAVIVVLIAVLLFVLIIARRRRSQKSVDTADSVNAMGMTSIGKVMPGGGIANSYQSISEVPKTYSSVVEVPKSYGEVPKSYGNLELVQGNLYQVSVFLRVVDFF